MKKVILSISAAAFVMAALPSCNKSDKQIAAPSNTATSAANGSGNTNGIAHRGRSYGGKHIKGQPCAKNDPSDCIILEEIIVRGKATALLAAIVGGPHNVADFFNSEDGRSIAEAIPVECSNKLKSGNYSAAVSYQSDHELVMIASPMPETTSENLEFAIDLTFQ